MTLALPLEPQGTCPHDHEWRFAVSGSGGVIIACLRCGSNIEVPTP